MNFLEKLNSNQKKAVLHTEGPLLIFAGAGSGKTRVITYRIAYLINYRQIQPYNIFAVTFTNKAAEEMKKRIINLIGTPGNSVFIKTFHSASAYILRRYGEKIGIPQTFSIYDRSEQEAVIKEVLLRMRLDPKKIRPSMIASKISEVKDKPDIIEGTDPKLLLPDNFPFNLPEIYKKYHENLKTLNALDFNDLLIRVVELLREVPAVLHELQRRWNYFMIDEYQDTNYAQYLITKHLSSASRNVCVVGDDDQSIYSWRGADIRNILNFEKDYNDPGIITLDENYRSTQPILDAANSIIRNNINRKEKKLKSIKGEGEPAIWCQANNEYGEAEFVVNSAISLKHREGFRNCDFAIFYRTNAQSRVFEDHLRKENIPYRVIGGLKFYDRKEIKDILAYLKFISNRLDSISLLRIINSPSRGIGKATINRIKDISQTQGISEWTVIEQDYLSGRVPGGINQFKNIINTAKELASKIPKDDKLSNFVNKIIEISGYKKSLVDENTIESNARLENIKELINSLCDYEMTNPEATLDQFLQDISLYTSEESPNVNDDGENDFVTLMTVHNAKGLEFPVVFLTGMEENIFPHILSIDTEDGIEEERRLCYVGITRAMERIYITNAEIRRSYRGIDYKMASRFISEIPEELIEKQSHYSDNFHFSNTRRNNYYKTDFPGHSENNGFTSVAAISSSSGTTADKGSKFSTWERVLHPKYGIGQIVKIDGYGDNVKLTILFGQSKKVFLEKYTPLEKLN